MVFFMCIVIHMYVFIWGGGVCVGHRPTCQVCLSFLPYFLRQILSLNLDLTNLARLIGHQVLGHRSSPL